MIRQPGPFSVKLKLQVFVSALEFMFARSLQSNSGMNIEQSDC